MQTVLVVNGPNLNMLGTREPAIYGTLTLEQICERVRARAEALHVAVDCFQSNSEGALIDYLQQHSQTAHGLIINAGAFTHYSLALRDALASLKMPVIEVHMSNIYARESFRHHSVLAPVCRGHIVGLGWRSYLLALEAVVELLQEEQ